jgi:hypothetical protein
VRRCEITGGGCVRCRKVRPNPAKDTAIPSPKQAEQTAKGEMSDARRRRLEALWLQLRADAREPVEELGRIEEASKLIAERRTREAGDHLAPRRRVDTSEEELSIILMCSLLILNLSKFSSNIDRSPQPDRSMLSACCEKRSMQTACSPSFNERQSIMKLLP